MLKPNEANGQRIESLSGSTPGAPQDRDLRPYANGSNGSRVPAAAFPSGLHHADHVADLSIFVADVIGLALSILLGQALFVVLRGHSPSVVRAPSVLIFVGPFLLGLALFGSYHYEARRFLRSFVSDLAWATFLAMGGAFAIVGGQQWWWARWRTKPHAVPQA